MLALIAHIPREIMQEGFHSFSVDFLEMFWKGGQDIKADSSNRIFLQSFFECAWYLLIQNCKENDETTPILNIGFVAPFESFICQPDVKHAYFEKEWCDCVTKMAKSSQVKGNYGVFRDEYR
jgi:hypothetical protein